MNARPTVSVVIPAFRAEASIERVVRGILDQSEDVFEIIVVADGAADATPEVAARLAAEHPSVRDLALPDNVGVAAARDAGSSIATGDYVLFADADDSMPRDAVEALVDRAVESGADVVVGGAIALLPSGGTDFVLRGPREFDVVPRQFAFRLLLRGVVTGHLWNKLIRRSVLDACRPFPRSDVHSDLALTAEVVAHASIVAFTNRIVYRYHSTPGSILKSGRSRWKSLDAVEASTQASASAIDPALLGTRDFRYFLTRNINLSRVKDAVLGPYSRIESNRLARAAQRRVRWSDIVLLAQRRDNRRVLMALSAKTSLRVHTLLLTRGRDSDARPAGPAAAVSPDAGELTT